MRLRKPTPAFVVAVGALLVSLGGTSYAVSQIGTLDIKDNSVRSIDIRNNTVRSADVRDGTLRKADFADGVLQSGDRGPRGFKGAPGEDGTDGTNGTNGVDGADGAPGAGRWVLINAAGQIEAQSGGFTVAAAYPTLTNTAMTGDNSLRANGNVYINAGEDLSNNGVFATIALQNQLDQNADTITNGRAPLADANPEFAGEISATLCGVSMVVACAPTGTNNSSHFVVSPRNSDGTVTADGTHKRFYVIITGDSTDLVLP
ncbi:MAG: collagen-like protein [Propionibacteriales bacterium]|nr:collagen-like protein [Propionibacteriales bacterium]